MAYGDRIWKYNRIRCKECNAILLDRDKRTLPYLTTGAFGNSWYCKTCRKYVQPKGIKVFGKEWSCRYCKKRKFDKRKNLMHHEETCKIARPWWLGKSVDKRFEKQNLHLIEEDVLHVTHHPTLHSAGIPAFDNWFWNLVEKGDWWMRTSPEEIQQKRRESWYYH